jgi:hypothetical protein
LRPLIEADPEVLRMELDTKLRGTVRTELEEISVGLELLISWKRGPPTTTRIITVVLLMKQTLLKPRKCIGRIWLPGSSQVF